MIKKPKAILKPKLKMIKKTQINFKPKRFFTNRLSALKWRKIVSNRENANFRLHRRKNV